jgi:hypothetical protein
LPRVSRTSGAGANFSIALRDSPFAAQAFEVRPIIGLELGNQVAMSVAVSVAEHAESNQVGRIVIELISIQVMDMKKVSALFEINAAALTLVLSLGANLRVD